MRKNVLLFGLLLSAMSAFAMPAKKGVNKTLTLSDGTTITVTLRGDEYGHYWQSEDGRKFTADDNMKELTEADFTTMKASSQLRRTNINAIRSNRMKAARRVGTFNTFEGEKKGLIILVNFNNLTMKSTSTPEFFDNMFNQVGFSKNNHIGSVHDYFYDQSYGKFDLEFDVVGPVTVSKNYSYYGTNDSYGNDKYPCSMVIEACKLVNDSVNFADYDWDGDGYVDQVYVVYAGYGENSGASSSTIWPHEWQLSEGKDYGDGTGELTLDDVTINTYATSCELCGTSGSTVDGIGTACHEFSHCLGYPDFYDTDYSGGWGMQAWDILDRGSYNGPDGNGEVPAGYTAYERWVAGWLTPTELKAGEAVEPLKALNDTAQAYIAYNDNNTNEYYLFENREPSRWFSYVEDYNVSRQGMLVTHVDYDADAWYNDTPNDDKNHQRMTIVRANGDNGKGTYFSSAGDYSVSQSCYNGHMFPYNGLDSLTNKSTPATDLYTANKAGKKYLSVSINNIKLEDDGTITFTADEPYYVTEGTSVDPTSEDVIFYESFDKCNGTGGNDDQWNGQGVASSATNFIPDNDGWTSNKYYGGDQCARFGSSSLAGVVTSPEFNYTGDVVVSFKAGAWNSSKDGTSLTVKVNDKDIDVYEMEKGAWTTFSFSTTLDGATTLQFVPVNRFFLDEVVVAKELVADGVKSVPFANKNDNRVYSVSGQYLGNDMNILPSGLYIRNGKKVLKK